MGARRRARECGLQVLYQLEASLKKARDKRLRRPAPEAERTPLATATPAEVDQALADFFGNFDAPERTHAYTERLVRGVVGEIERIDEILQRHSPRWRVSRMSLVDRNVLRLGVWELLHADDVPWKVILDEGVEIARRFGSEQSGAFVNGVLDAVARELRPAEAEKERR